MLNCLVVVIRPGLALEFFDKFLKRGRVIFFNLLPVRFHVIHIHHVVNVPFKTLLNVLIECFMMDERVNKCCLIEPKL